MKLISAILVLITSLVSVAAEGLEVAFNCPEVISNETPTPIQLSIAGGDIGAGEVTKIRTVLYKPNKRGPKFFGNITHTEFNTVDASHYEVVPAYTLPVQNYKVGFSVLVQYEEEQEWIDSELFDVRIQDPSVNPVQVFASVLFIAAALFGVCQLALRMAAPGYWEATLPAWMHKFLPDQNQKKRN